MSPILSPPAPAKRKRARAHRRADLAIGVVLGLLIGLAVVSAFVFLGSERTVDAPRLPAHGAAGRPALQARP